MNECLFTLIVLQLHDPSMQAHSCEISHHNLCEKNYFTEVPFVMCNRSRKVKNFSTYLNLEEIVIYTILGTHTSIQQLRWIVNIVGDGETLPVLNRW